MSAKVSIFIPVYNGGNFLKYSIESVMRQTYTDWELLCVDDSSTDDSYKQLMQYHQKDERVRAFQKPNGGNVPKSWNFIFPYISGDYVMYMSQDDMIDPDALQKMVHAMSDDVDYVVPRYFDYDYSTGKATFNKNLNKIENLRRKVDGIQAFALSLKWQIHGFGLFRRSLIDGIVLRDDIYISDEWMSRRTFLLSRKVVLCACNVYRGNNPEAITKQPKPYLVEGLIRDMMITDLFREYQLPVQLEIYWRSICLRGILWTYRYIIEAQNNWTLQEREGAIRVYNMVRDSVTWRDILFVLLRKPLSTIRYVDKVCELSQYHGILFIKRCCLFRYKAIYSFLKSKSL